MKIIHKILFCLRITTDLPSFLRLIINSKKLSRSKSRIIPPQKIDKFFSINFSFNGLKKTIYLRTYRGDIDIFYEIFQKGIYALPTTKTNVEVIIDLGANVGLSALYFSALFPQAKIICVEPGKDNFRFLQKNLEDNINTGKVEVAHAAIMGTDGMVSFEDGKMHYNGKVTTNGQDIDALSMSKLFDIYSVPKADLVKMDIEGAEQDIFNADLEWLDNIKTLIIEMHSDKIRDHCNAILAQKNFKVFQIPSDQKNAYLFRATKE